MKKGREVKNWYILIQELNVICQADRKNKWSGLYLIKIKFGFGREGGWNFVGFCRSSILKSIKSAEINNITE